MSKPSRATHPPSQPSDLFRMLPMRPPMRFFHQARMAQSAFGTSAQALPHSAVSLCPTPLTEMYLPLNRECDDLCFSQQHNICCFDKCWIVHLMNPTAVTTPSDCIYRRKHARIALL